MGLACGPISAQYRHYRRDRRPVRGEEGTFERMTIRIGFVAGMLLLTGCATTGLTGNGSDTAPKAGKDSGSVTSTVLEELGDGLIGGNIGSGLTAADKRKALPDGHLEERPGRALWRSGCRAALSRRLAGLPPVSPHRLFGRQRPDRPWHGLPQHRRVVDAADLTLERRASFLDAQKDAPTI